MRKPDMTMTMFGDGQPVRRSPMAGINEACGLFESAWQTGGRPRIEDSLGDVSEPARGELLRRLLALEVFYRRRLGEAPAEDDYWVRFPGHECLIADVVGTSRQGGPGSPSTEVEATGPETGRPDRLTSGVGLEILRGMLGDAEADPPRTYPSIPDYEILRELGRGGAGIVYLARGVRLNRLCA